MKVGVMTTKVVMADLCVADLIMIKTVEFADFEVDSKMKGKVEADLIG
jgi:hypothetical protein